MQMRPHIMLQGGVAEAAIAHWRRAFGDLVVKEPEPPALLWHITCGGQTFTLFDSPEPHEFGPTPTWSFMVDLDTADAVDRIHEVLAQDGGTLMPPDTYPFAQRFAWVEDRFGLSWQLRFGPS